MSNFPRKQGSQPENTNALKHGGAAATVAIQEGKPLTGPAREAELAVYEQLETEGRYSLVRRGAARLEAAAQCYWGAICRLIELADQKDPDVVVLKLDRYVARFGWLQGAALRAWAQVKEEEKDGAGAMVTDYETILSGSG